VPPRLLSQVWILPYCAYEYIWSYFFFLILVNESRDIQTAEYIYLGTIQYTAYIM